MVKVIILTGTELRHNFVRKSIALDPGISVLKTYCEESEKSLTNKIDKNNVKSEIQFLHLKARKYSEYDFFKHFVTLVPDKSNPIEIPKGDINKKEHLNKILGLNPDVLVAYGCSLIEEPLLSKFKNKLLNVHLGLSPYYRGTGTNFWPLVNGEPQYVGATFMHIDAGIDTGEIIHQIRARIHPSDTPHQIGNRLIADMSPVYIKIIKNLLDLKQSQKLSIPDDTKYYRAKDFTPESVEKLYENFENNMIVDYLKNEMALIQSAPIIENNFLKNVSS